MTFRSKKPLIALILNIVTLAVILLIKNSNVLSAKIPEVGRNISSGAEPPAKKLYPFTTDGCSNWPNGNWLECCIVHDVSYWKGGTLEERKIADQKLGECVSRKNPEILGKLMEAGTQLGGSPKLPTSYRWGYGWNYNRNYLPLSPEELKQVEVYRSLAQLPPLIRLPPKLTEALSVLDRERRQNQIEKNLLSYLKRQPQEVYFVQVSGHEGRHFQVFEKRCPQAYFEIVFEFISEKVVKLEQVGECLI